MNKSTLDGNETNRHDEPETFEQIVLRKYGGSIGKACAELKADRRMIWNLLSGKFTRGNDVKQQRIVAAELGREPHELFPDELYPSPRFDHIADAPGYKRLKKKYPLLKAVRKKSHGLLTAFKEVKPK